MITRRYSAPAAAQDPILLVLLPGAGISVEDFAENGMIDAVHARGLAVDIAATAPDLELYLDGGITAALHRAIIEPALSQGYARIWLLGISMGGMGALLYAAAYEAEIEGVILLAPFLGTRGTIAELGRAGGLASWAAAGSAATVTEQRMLTGLQSFARRQPASPVLYLGYGQDDRFAAGHRLLADALPCGHVVTATGGHDWATWATLWQRVLDAAPFTTTPAKTL